MVSQLLTSVLLMWFTPSLIHTFIVFFFGNRMLVMERDPFLDLKTQNPQGQLHCVAIAFNGRKMQQKKDE